MKQVPFVDLQRIHQPLRPELERAIGAVLDRGDFVLGGELRAFEEQFARYCGASECVGVGSGMDALCLALRAMGIGPDDEVVTTTHTFFATVAAISRVGATPVLVDCLEPTLCIDPQQVEDALTPRTRLILPVHLYGRLADMTAIEAIAERHGLRVLEDAAQAHGAERDGQRAGSRGNPACFSFYPGKNLGAFGDGGAITSSDGEFVDHLRLLRGYGERPKNSHVLISGNSRLDTLQAAILRIKLAHLDDWNRTRVRAAARYRELLVDLPVGLPAAPTDRELHVHHLFVIRIEGRDRVRERLAERGIATGIHYPTPVHLQPAYSGLGKGPGSYPVSEKASSELLSLPFFAGISDAEIDHVAETLRDLLS